jgi:hypothetical protein
MKNKVTIIKKNDDKTALAELPQLSFSVGTQGTVCFWLQLFPKQDCLHTPYS